MAERIQVNTISVESGKVFETYIEIPSMMDAEGFWNMEQELHKITARVADQIMISQIEKLHADNAFVEKAIEQAREDRDLPLIHKGWKEVSVLLLGGTRIIIKTPYLLEDKGSKRGAKRSKRGKKGSGVYPVLEAIGIHDGVSAATRGEIALYTVQTASYHEAIELLARRGLSCDVSTLSRIACTTANQDISLRDAALCAAMNIPISADGPLAGKRVRISMDGGRIRTRKNKKGRKTSKGRHRFSTPWREPRVLVIDLLDEEGNFDRSTLPLYDALMTMLMLFFICS